MKAVTVKYGQTVEDLALLHYGCLEGVIRIMADNDISVDGLLYAGQQILIEDPTPEITDNNLALLADIRYEAVDPVTGVAGSPPEKDYVDDNYVDEDYFQDQ